MNFRRVLDLEDIPGNISDINPTNVAPSLVESPDILVPSLPRDFLKRKRGGNQEEIDEVSLFRRVRIYNDIHNLALPNPPRSDLDYRIRVQNFYTNSELNGHNSGSLYYQSEMGVIKLRLVPKVSRTDLVAFKNELQGSH